MPMPGIPEATAREIRRLDFGIAVCGVWQGRCLSSPKISPTRRIYIRSCPFVWYYCLCMPSAHHQGRAIGTLSFGTSTRPRFSEEDIEFIRAITDLVATAMARKKVERELIRKVEYSAPPMKKSPQRERNSGRTLKNSASASGN